MADRGPVSLVLAPPDHGVGASVRGGNPTHRVRGRAELGYGEQAAGALPAWPIRVLS